MNFAKLSGIGALMICSACGGGDPDPDPGNNANLPQPPYIGLFNASSTETSVLRGFGLTSDGSVSTATGTLDRATQTISVLGIDGMISGTDVSLTAGGQATLGTSDLEYTATFISEPTSGANLIGVVGVPTDIGELPAAATYSGTASVLINDGTALFELVGDSAANLDFGAGTGSLTLSGLKGSRTTGSSAPTTVNNAATITVNNLTNNGNTFSGGDVSISSNALAVGLSSGEFVESAVGVFGPEASEFGGVLSVDDTAGGSLTVQGTFVGD